MVFAAYATVDGAFRLKGLRPGTDRSPTAHAVSGYFGLIAQAGPSNQIDLHPMLTLDPRHDLTVTTGWLFFWRHRIDDGIYATSGSLLRSAEGTRSRSVGHSPGIEARWQVTNDLSLTGNASVFTAGTYIRESGPARPIRFLAGWLTYRFGSPRTSADYTTRRRS